MSASDALRRHLLGQGLQEDRQTLIDCHRAINERPGGPVELRSGLFDGEVRSHHGIHPRCSTGQVLDCLYGIGQRPTANMAIALALDEIDATPGRWVAEVDEGDRWEIPEDDEDELELEEVG